jgi:pimeloyl-ACP methyl ester carboxylesterase
MLSTRAHKFLNPNRHSRYTVEHITLQVGGLEQSQISTANLKIPFIDSLKTKPTESQMPIAASRFLPNDWRGETALFIPGAGADRHVFNWLLFSKLLDQNIGILSIDPPGHGDSMSAPTTVHNVQRVAQVASDWLHTQPGVTRVGAIGLSFGGNQAAWLAANDDRIRALVTISSPVTLPPVTRRVIALEGINLLRPSNLLLVKHQSPLHVVAEYRKVKGAWFGESLYDMIDSFDMLNVIRAVGKRPTLFVHGNLDVAVPPRNAYLLYEAALPDRELLIVKGATHLSVTLFEREMMRVAEWFGNHIRR